MLVTFFASMLLATSAVGNFHTDNTSLMINADGRILHYGLRLDDSATNALEAIKDDVNTAEEWHRKPSLNSRTGEACMKVGKTLERINEGGLTYEGELEITENVIPYHKSDVLKVQLTLHNPTTSPIALYRMDTIDMFLPIRSREVGVRALASEWGTENHLLEHAVPSGETVRFSSLSGARPAFGNNPAMMVRLGEANEDGGEVIGVALASGGSWEMALTHDVMDGVTIRAGAYQTEGAYNLAPGATITLPSVFLTYTDKGYGQVSRNFHKFLRESYMNQNLPPEREVVLNSWEGAYFTFDEATLIKMMDGASELGAEMFVLDDGWFGNGEFARNSSRYGLGDWQVNEAKLPHGLEYLAQAAAARGLKFGLWIEPEMVNIKSQLYTSHPDWVIRDSFKLRTGRGGTQAVLDFGRKEVVDYIFNDLVKVFETCPSLAYVKWDANANFMNVTDGNTRFDYTAGLQELRRRLAERFPNIVFQSCCSGGGRMDFGSLKYANEFWTSDDTDARERVFIQWGASQFYPAVAMAAHVTKSPNEQTRRELPLKFRFDVAFCGRLGFELRPWDLTTNEVAFAKAAVESYKAHRKTIQQGELYRLVSPYQDSRAVLEYLASDGSEAIVIQLGLTKECHTNPATPIKLKGLDPNANYLVTELNVADKVHALANNQILSGAVLMNRGITLTRYRDYDSAVVLCKKVIEE